MRRASLAIMMSGLLLGSVLHAFAVLAQDTTSAAAVVVAEPEQPAVESLHQELIAMREGIVAAVNSQDVDSLLTYLHPDIVVVWQDAEVSRGHEGVRQYYRDKLGSPDAILDSYTVEPTVAERTALHGEDMGIAYGTVLCHFAFKNGREFDLTGPWSATLVRTDGSWQIASFHASSGLFDNPLLAQLRTWLLWGCVAAGIAGVVIGAVIVALLKRRRPTTST